MAGIKETKEQLREELKNLHRKWTDMSGILSSAEATSSAWMELAEISNEFARKAAVLAHLADIDEKQPEAEIPPVIIPEIKTPEVIVPPRVPVAENISAEENNIPPLVPVTEKTSPPEIVPPVPKKLPDLKSLIGFNEKIMFVRNLFNSSGPDYENALASLNACISYHEAETLLQELASSRNWSRENEPVQVFYSLVKRRFV